MVTNLLINSISNSGSNRNVSEVKISNMSDVSKNSNGTKMGNIDQIENCQEIIMEIRFLMQMDHIHKLELKKEEERLILKQENGIMIRMVI